MTRVVSYNILAGGYNLRAHETNRTEQLLKIIRSVQPDVVGLPEAIHQQITKKPFVVEELAEALGMQFIPSGKPIVRTDYQSGMMTRLPVVYKKIHDLPGILARPLLEVCLEESNGQHLTVFVTHLSASFNRRWAGNHIRVREVQEIMRIMAPLYTEGKPHLLMGDFNSLAPQDAFKASALLKYVVHQETRWIKQSISDGHPYLNSVVPPKLRVLNPLLRTIAQNELLCRFFDVAAYFYAPRGCIQPLNEKYADCFRTLHPNENGFTCPAAAPAGRIDYIFANKVLAERLQRCEVLETGEDGVMGSDASDHLAIMAEFGAGMPSAELYTPVENTSESASTH
jgi:endonuclease/exonuclease/phosphatase family metal-dependent hydrolase